MACREVEIAERQTKESERSLKNKNHSGGPTPEKTTREPGLPTKEELRQFIHDSLDPQDKRDIARHFGIKGQDRTRLRIMLRELSEEGGVEKNPTRTYKAPNNLPETALIEITGLDGDGELRAKPVEWYGRGPEPIIYVMYKRREEGEEAKPGDRVLARLKKVDKHEYEARILKPMKEEENDRVIGTFKSYKGAGYVYPTEKKNRQDYFIPTEHMNDAQEGDLVIAELIPPSQKNPRSKNPARIIKRLGKKGDPRLISLISIHSHGIPTEFSNETLSEAAKMKEPDLSGGREDLRQIPLVTIDGADARDFDDAVFAEPDTDPKNAGGWHLMVAIADVSFYVQPHTALDKDAYERGNSTYFADRVVPMLPERLSNDLCSLRPHVNRACLAVHLWIDSHARLKHWQFTRGLMRSVARLTYEQVEQAHLGTPDETTAPLMDNVIKPLYRAYSLLKHAREVRGALELDLPERKAIIDAEGNLTAIVPRQRLASHQLIEEFMILANVAAAQALEAKNAPCVYRVHDRPAYDRLESTRDFLKEFGYSLPKTDQLSSKNFNQILKLSAEREDKQLIHTILLRTQSQAIYSPNNLGHFGLALEKYAHFTSPIRRYADLLVHRSLVRAYGLGEGPLTDHETQYLVEISEHISSTERRSMLAERDVMDRFTAQYLSANVGKEFKGHIASVTRFGLFVALDDTGADGIVPMRSLPRDYYVHDEKRHALVGKDSGRTYRLADAVLVRLVEADAMRGSTVFEIIDGITGSDAPGARQRGGAGEQGQRSRRGRGGGGRSQDKHRGKGGRGKRR